MKKLLTLLFTSILVFSLAMPVFATQDASSDTAKAEKKEKKKKEKKEKKSKKEKKMDEAPKQ